MFRESASSRAESVALKAMTARNVARRLAEYLSLKTNPPGASSAGFADRGRQGSFDLEVASGLLAAIRHDLVLELLTFIERAQAGALDRRYMNENILAAALRLNESVAFLRIEPLHRTERHVLISPLMTKDSL
jgi:hypothetical protein